MLGEERLTVAPLEGFPVGWFSPTNLGHIDCGVEIVPLKAFADAMSTGVAYFEQLVWDLEHRGVSNIDVPVLILGID